MQIRQYPNLSSATVTVTTTYPGANADVIKGFITTPLEQAVASAEGVDTLVSSSQQNVSTITLNLRLNANADRAMTDVLAKVNQVKYQLPRDAMDPVVVKQAGQGTALLYMSFNSDTLSPAQITDYITRVVQPRLQTIDGVASAQILGGQNFAMRVWLDPDKMAARGVTASDIRNALLANNFTSAAGQIKGDFTQTSNQRPDLARQCAGLWTIGGFQSRRRPSAARRCRPYRVGAGKRRFLGGFRRTQGGVHRRLRHAVRQSVDRHHRRAQGFSEHRGGSAGRSQRRDRL